MENNAQLQKLYLATRPETGFIFHLYRDIRDDIKLCHWFPKFPFYHSYQIWSKDCLKYENRMRLVRPPFLSPPPHHNHWHYFDITKLPYQNNIPDMLKKPPKVRVSLMCWFRDLWWSSTIFWMNMTESCLFVNWRQFYDEYPSYDKFFIIWCVSCPSNGKKLMMDVQHMMGIHHTLRVLFLFCNQRSKVYLLF